MFGCARNLVSNLLVLDGMGPREDESAARSGNVDTNPGPSVSRLMRRANGNPDGHARQGRLRCCHRRPSPFKLASAGGVLSITHRPKSLSPVAATG